MTYMYGFDYSPSRSRDLSRPPRAMARDGAFNDETGNHMSLIDGMENAAV